MGLTTESVLSPNPWGIWVLGRKKYSGIDRGTICTCTGIVAIALTIRIWRSTCSTWTPAPWIIHGGSLFLCNLDIRDRVADCTNRVCSLGSAGIAFGASQCILACALPFPFVALLCECPNCTFGEHAVAVAVFIEPRAFQLTGASNRITSCFWPFPTPLMQSSIRVAANSQLAVRDRVRFATRPPDSWQCVSSRGQSLWFAYMAFFNFCLEGVSVY